MKLVLLILLLPCLAFGQLNENFSDGSLSTGVIWSGDTSNYKVNSNFQLQLASSGEGVNSIFTPLFDQPQEWSFWVKMSFSPSDNNNSRIFLVTDKQDFSSSLNGYYLKLGETGTTDAIELYRQDGESHILVARGKDGFLAKAFSVRIKIVRDDGQWEIWADSTGNTAYEFQATGTDEVWEDYHFFGIECRHTSSNATKFYFDDLYAGPLIFDATPPQFLSVDASDINKIELKFNETISNISAGNPNNYKLNSHSINPIAAGTLQDDPSIVQVLFDSDFQEDTLYSLRVENLTDMTGNIMNPVMTNFQYSPIKEFDILINEIMADPDPSKEFICEYLELYNRANHSVRLNDYYLCVGSSKKKLPEITIPSKGYHIITSAGNDTLMQNYGQVSAVSGFSLNNTGCPVILKNRNDCLIHAISYNEEWYHDSRKSAGGWSIELIDPMNPCGGLNNWTASENIGGGTPGTINSVFNINSDDQPPHIDHIMVTSQTEIQVHFSESIDSLKLSDVYAYEVDRGIGFPVGVKLIAPEYTSAVLNFSQSFDKKLKYILSVNNIIEDCAGNSIEETAMSEFGWSYPPKAGDLLFNEILFEPLTNGADFIELYNLSDYNIDLTNIRIAFIDTISGQIQSDYLLSNERRSLFPHVYAAFTSNPEGVKADYFVPTQASIVETKNFPALPNSGSTLCLINNDDEILDIVYYDSEMHFPLLTSTKGVSLEKIDPMKPSIQISNWHSASHSVGFASPGYQNSQFMISKKPDNKIEIEPSTFTPDNDGKDDNIIISCILDEPGNLITIKIFDAYGSMVRTLAANHLAGNVNQFVWDGITESKELAKSGIYVILTEILNTNGSVYSHKGAVVLGLQ